MEASHCLQSGQESGRISGQVPAGLWRGPPPSDFDRSFCNLFTRTCFRPMISRIIIRFYSSLVPFCESNFKDKLKRNFQNISEPYSCSIFLTTWGPVVMVYYSLFRHARGPSRGSYGGSLNSRLNLLARITWWVSSVCLLEFYGLDSCLACRITCLASLVLKKNGVGCVLYRTRSHLKQMTHA